MAGTLLFDACKLPACCPVCALVLRSVKAQATILELLDNCGLQGVIGCMALEQVKLRHDLGVIGCVALAKRQGTAQILERSAAWLLYKCRAWLGHEFKSAACM